MKKLDTLVIPSDPGKLIVVDSFTERITGQLGFSRDKRDDIAISVSEAAINAIMHGNGGDRNKTVTFKFLSTVKGLRIEVTDQGVGFEAEKVPDPTREENLLIPYGRGLLIIRHLMDEVKIKVGKTGTKIVMTKFFESPITGLPHE